MNWIKWDKQRPPINRYILVRCGTDDYEVVYYATSDSGEEFLLHHDGGEVTPNSVTHWCYIITPEEQ